MASVSVAGVLVGGVGEACVQPHTSGGRRSGLQHRRGISVEGVSYVRLGNFLVPLKCTANCFCDFVFIQCESIKSIELKNKVK